VGNKQGDIKMEKRIIITLTDEGVKTSMEDVNVVESIGALTVSFNNMIKSFSRKKIKNPDMTADKKEPA
jgi:hypothetical protein